MAKRCYTIEHLREAARSKLPRMVFEFVDGGSGSESALRRNRSAFEDVRLMPRALVDARQAHIRTSVFDQSFSAPIGIAPMGLCNLVAPGADEALAATAAKANVPYCLSTAATASIERIAAIAPEQMWFQLYVTSDDQVTDDLVRRAEAAGAKTLLVTVDIPISAKRVRDLVNGLTLPMRPTARTALDLARHPLWLARSLRHGAPRFEMLTSYFPADEGVMSHAATTAKLLASGLLDWTTIARLRDKWPRKLVIKGILNPQDALRAADLGVDGVVVSNHGGRQLDGAPATIEMLPEIRRAVGDRLRLLIDSGLRTGDDIVKALALGADFVLLGRPFLFGVAALGTRVGPEATLSMLTDEIRNTLIHVGCRSIDELSAERIWRAPRGGNDG